MSDICNLTVPHNYHLPGFWETNDTAVGVALPEDKFGLAYIHKDDITSQLYTRFRVIDPSIPDNTYSVAFEKIQKENPVRMTYLDKKNTVELLQPIVHASDFVEFDLNNNSGYITPMLTPTNDVYRTMHSIYGRSFISSHENQIYLQNMTASFPPSTAGCPAIDYLEVFHIDNVIPVSIDAPTSNTCYYFPTGVRANNITRICVNDCFSIE